MNAPFSPVPFTVAPCGDSALSLEFPNEISPAVHAAVTAAARAVEAAHLEGVIEWIPTYRALMVAFDPLQLSFAALMEKLAALPPAAARTEARADAVEIPVCYGGEFGPDLAFVASHTGLPPEEVIRLHAAPDYCVYMLGFTPGFPYLGGMDGRLATPRLASPRTRIPAGSVGIAGPQTGVYPSASPGGWQLIGRTPLPLYAPARKEPFLLHAGQTLRFIPILEAEYRSLEREANAHA